MESYFRFEICVVGDIVECFFVFVFARMYLVTVYRKESIVTYEVGFGN